MLVFAWIPKGKEIGHASLQLAGHYVSPQSLAEPALDGAWTFDDDVELFGRMPHLALQIRKLDEAEMLRHWRRIERRQDGVTGSRGLTAVAGTLCAGLSNAQAESAARLQCPDSVQLHTQFVTYVYAVSLALNQGIPMNLMHRKHLLRRALGQGRRGAKPQTPLRIDASRATMRQPMMAPLAASPIG